MSVLPQKKRRRKEGADAGGSGTYLDLCRHPSRDGPLAVHWSTLSCLRAGCVACAYKVVVEPSDSAPNSSFVPNQRPEECFRMRRFLQRTGSDRHKEPASIYSSKENILVVGDGNLSFSLCLARDFDCARKMFATTYLSLAELIEAYGPSISKTISELHELGVTVLHEVDATRLETTLSPRCEKVKRFDRVIWNFPCVTGGSEGKDGQLSEIEDNKSLMRSFFQNVGSVLARGGEVHVSHKTKAPFCHWGLQELAASGEDRLMYCGAVIFDSSMHPAYDNKKVAAGRGKFPTWDAKIFIWQRKSKKKTKAAASTMLPQPWSRRPWQELVPEAPTLLAIQRDLRAKRAASGKRANPATVCPLDDSCDDRWEALGADSGGLQEAGDGLVGVDSALLKHVCRLLRRQ